MSQDKALLVEEEVGRVFCSEECIAEYFSPEIERLEKDYFRHLSPGDLSPEEREKYSHLRWITLEEPDEVWREKTLSGDFRYTLISEFQPDDKPVWCVCICLFLRGEPSFLYLAFPTRNAGMVDRYRRGERMQWAKNKPSEAAAGKASQASSGAPAGQTGRVQLLDGLAEPWTEDETIRAQLNQRRTADDIPNSDFELYHRLMDGTLEEPDEVWSLQPNGEKSMKIYHFIRHYPETDSGVWYVIVARETDDEEQIEILDGFPTRDRDLVDRYRRGNLEVGQPEHAAPSRLVH